MHYAIRYLHQRQLRGSYIQLVTNVLCFLHYAKCFTANSLGPTISGPFCEQKLSCNKKGA